MVGCVCVCVCMCVCVCVYLCLCLFVFVCMFITACVYHSYHHSASSHLLSPLSLHLPTSKNTYVVPAHPSYRHPDTFHPLSPTPNTQGIMATPYRQTTDGYESQFQTNHLSQFLLAQLLTPDLITTATATTTNNNNSSSNSAVGNPTSGRVVVLSSAAQFMAPTHKGLPFETFTSDVMYSPWETYGRTKLYVCLCVCLFVCVFACLCGCLFVWVFVYVCVWVCVHTPPTCPLLHHHHHHHHHYTNTSTNTHTDAMCSSPESTMCSTRTRQYKQYVVIPEVY